MTNNRSIAAKFYAHQHGWCVVPIVPSSKRPFVKWKHLTREESHERVDEWWNEHPDALVGVLTGKRSGGLVVVDIDTRDASDLTSDDISLLRTLPSVTKRAKTPGGEHVYATTKAHVPNRNRITPNIDIRGEGGLVVAPPAKGRVWDGDFSVDALPKEALKFLRAKRRERKAGLDSIPGFLPGFGDEALEDASEAVANATEGERNETLNRECYYLAAYVARREIDPERFRDEMTAAGLAAGLGDREVERTVESALTSILEAAT